MKESHYDLVILGSGSTAFAAALRAQEFGKTSVMTEERTTGGTCVNRGCLPSKNLIEAAKIIHDARHPRYPGLTPAELGLDFRKLIEQKDEVIHGYRKKKYESLTGGQFTIEKGHVEFVDDRSVQVDGKRFTGEKILIATGSRPVVPNIEGLRDVPYLTSDLLTNDEPMELWELPGSLIILGAGLYRFGVGADVSPFWRQGHDCPAQPAIARARLRTGGRRGHPRSFRKRRDQSHYRRHRPLGATEWNGSHCRRRDWQPDA